jgi:predicted P-loop ATPase
MQGKDAFQQLQGSWIIELAELSAMRKSELENVKHFITKQEDSFRMPYGRVVETFKRQCIFIGTTNKTEFLSDDTGNRRFLPISLPDPRFVKDVKSVWDMSKETVGQIWAEAKTMYDRGEKLFLSGEADAEAKKSQRAHAEYDAQMGEIGEFLEIKISKDWYDLNTETKALSLEAGGLTEERQTVSAVEIWVEMMGKARQDFPRNQSRIIMSNLRQMEGWEFVNSPKRFGAYGKQKYFKRSKNNIDDII